MNIFLLLGIFTGALAIVWVILVLLNPIAYILGLGGDKALEQEVTIPTDQQRIDALTFAVIRGEMTIQELNVKVMEQANTISNLEGEVRRDKRGVVKALNSVFKGYQEWEDFAKELK